MSNFYTEQRAMTAAQNLECLQRLHATEKASNAKPSDARGASSDGKSAVPTSAKPQAMSVPLCSICRVSASSEHMQSDWHKFNEKATAEGKTPMAQNLYEQFEKSRFAGGASPTPASTQATTNTNSKNVNQWHWEEKNIASWAFERLETLLKESAFPVQGGAVLRISGVKEIEGDAYLNLRKGKLRVGFDLKCKLEWEGEIKAEDGSTVVKATGKGVLGEIDDSTEEDEYAEQVSGFTMEKNDEKGAELLLTTMKKLGPKVIAKQISKLVKEMMAKKDEQQS